MIQYLSMFTQGTHDFQLRELGGQTLHLVLSCRSEAVVLSTRNLSMKDLESGCGHKVKPVARLVGFHHQTREAQRLMLCSTWSKTSSLNEKAIEIKFYVRE